MTESPCTTDRPEPGARLSAPLELRSAEVAWLASAHPELLQALRESPAPAEPTLDVRGLPLATQRFVWKLYERHYPDMANWIRCLNMEAWREQFGATLGLSAADILAAVRREAEGSDSRE
jgi:hypothetical protein